jgi:hypothetical protein
MKDNWQNGPEFIRIDVRNAEIVIGSGYGEYESAGVCPLAEFQEDYCDYRDQVNKKFGQQILAEVISSVREVLSKSGCQCSESFTDPTKNSKLIEVNQSIESSSAAERIIHLYRCSVCGRNWRYLIDKDNNGATKSHLEMLKGCPKGCLINSDCK